MADTPAVTAAHLLGMAAVAQRDLDLDDPADYWYRLGVRDTHAYAAAILIHGRTGDLATYAVEHVVDLLGRGVTDVGVLMVSIEVPYRDASGLRWIGQLAFDRVSRSHPGIDHDLGSQWGPRHDVRISHRRVDGASTGLLYAYDRTWDEFAILDRAASVDVVERAYRAALDADPHLPPADFVLLLRANAPEVAAQPDPLGRQL